MINGSLLFIIYSDKWCIHDLAVLTTALFCIKDGCLGYLGALGPCLLPDTTTREKKLINGQQLC